MCPHCKHELASQDLIPLFSYISLRGKCRYCHKAISSQYPSVEFSTGVLFAVLYLVLNPSSVYELIQFVILLITSVLLVAAFVYDAKYMELPEKYMLPAVALGGEPPAPGVLDRPPSSGRLINRTVALRVFGVLGPTEALLSMTAFVTVFVAAGWRPGEPFPGGQVELMASGAAFTAVVAGQMANAFACRSTTRWPGSLGWTSNRLLLGAVAFEVVLAACFVAIPPLADLLGQAWPSAAGWLVVGLAAPALLLADATSKAVARRRRRRRVHGLAVPP